MNLRSFAAMVSLTFVWLSASNAHAQTNSPGDAVYLFSTFREPEQDGLRYAYSFDGYHWTNAPGLFLKARVGGGIMRDPSICRGPDGTWHVVWTTAWRGDRGFGHAQSKDLVHWSEQQFIPAMEHEPATTNVWAPELFYDDIKKQFIIYWASTIPGRFPDHLEPRENNHRMYYTATRDFKTFTPTKLFLDPDFSVIDCQILKVKDRPLTPSLSPSDGERVADLSTVASAQAEGRVRGNYVLLLKDNTRPQRNIRVAFGDSALGPWRDISTNLTAHLTEGPCGLKIGEDWIIYYESYNAKHYTAMKTRDFKTFADVTAEMTFPDGLKHGTAFKATRKDLEYLFKVGTQQVANVRLPWVSPVSQAEIDQRLAEIDKVAKRGPIRPDWASITNGFKTPQWYQDAKFGLFIHWGPYAVPAFGSEWYPREMYVAGTKEFKHHVETYGPQSKFGYKDFIPQFKAERFNATEWAKLFKQAGVKYVVPVAEHHDGFPMYASDLTDWSAAKHGPKRDVISEQAKAFRKAGIVFGASSHRAEHWFFFDNGMYGDTDVRDTNNASLYGPAVNKRMAEAQAEPPDKAFLDDWLLRSCELVDKYKPEVLYFDWWICQPVFQPYLKTFAAYYYNRGVEWKKQVAINFKEWEGYSFPRGSGVFDMERGQAGEIQPALWQTCTSVSRNSWGYVANHDYKDTGEIVDELVDIVSKNGTMLLNIGPKADGTIPGREQQMLREIGAWLKVNGEAIYGTRPWTQFGEGPTQTAAGSFADKKAKPQFTAEDFRFTTKDDTLYAIALAWPENGRLVVKSLAEGKGRMKRVRLLGHSGKLDWARTPAGLSVKLPAARPCDHAITLVITGDGLVK
jgi:alpha-L-fucosidase